MLAAAAVLGFTTEAAAQLKVSESVIDMDSNQTHHTLDLSNLGQGPIQISIDLLQVIEPASSHNDNETTTPAPEDVLRIEPASATVLPGDVLSVVIHHKSRSVVDDEIYRLLLTPSVVSTKTAAMNILLSYDLMLMIRPVGAQADIRLRHTHEGIALINHGKTNAMLTSMQLCDELTEICHHLPPTRMYSKQHLPIDVPDAFALEHGVLKTQHTLRNSSVHKHQRVPSLSTSQ